MTMRLLLACGCERAYAETADPKKTQAILDVAEKTIRDLLAHEPAPAVKKPKPKMKVLVKPKGKAK